MEDSSTADLTFDGPAIYRIRVRGKIKASWSDRLEGMAISMVARDDGPPVTTLVGKLIDQASLAGVLAALYELHLPLLSVECLRSIEGHGSQ
jgi:hypothetical protein